MYSTRQLDGSTGTAVTLIPGHRFFKLLFKADFILQVALLIYALNSTVAIGLLCYGMVIGLVVAAQRMTYDRNLRYTLCTSTQDG
jgi:hypothetical protein